MYQLIKWILVFVLLIPCTITDIKKRQVNVIWILLCGMIGLILFLWEHSFYLQLFIHVLPGFILIIISKVSKGGIGMGDCYIVLAMGLIIGWNYTIFCLFIALVGSSITSIIRMIKKGKKEIAFVPYLLVSSVITCVLYQR